MPASEHPWTLERAWTGDGVLEAVRAAWAASPRTEEATAVMLWPEVYLPASAADLRDALRMEGLSKQGGYPLHGRDGLVEGRLGWSWSKFDRCRDKACQAIADRLNGVDPLAKLVENKA